MEQLIEQFPDTLKPIDYRSFILQPERVSINSRQSLSIKPISTQFIDSDYYYQFTARLKNPLMNVKSLELLRATIPNVIPSIPNSEATFYYYKIPADPITFQPQYQNLTAANILMIRLTPSIGYSPDNYINPNIYGYNKTFANYQELVDELNKAALNDPLQSTLQPLGFYDPGDISFSYNESLNKIVFQGNNSVDLAGFPQFYYLPVGYADPNLELFQLAITNTLGPNNQPILFPVNGEYTLNRRLGYLWDGIYEDNPPVNPPVGSLSYTILESRTIPKPNFTGVPWTDLLPNYTAEGYADLVYTANVFVYCNIVGGSTQDTNTDEQLLAVVPMNTQNLGVNFGESKLSCPLTKISKEIYNISITLRTDTAQPFYLPNNAYVNLEIKFTY